jgi:glycosyltransferase involved in cell wall biosynthesis
MSQESAVSSHEPQDQMTTIGPREPLVTVIALCFNHERFLEDCLEGIRQQEYPNLQIIITDDCSKDSSATLIRRWIADNPSLRVTFLENDYNLGICKTLNRALGLAQGKYVAMTATDDMWLPGKISDQVRAMESLPDKVGVLYSDALQMDEVGALLPKRFIESYRRFSKMPEGQIHDAVWEGNFIPAMTTLIRRSIFATVGCYDESLFYEDWDMWLRVSEHFDFAYFPTPTAKYRVVRTSMSKSAVDRMTIANELIFIKYLLLRGVPSALRNHAFNFAVRRAFRERKNHPRESRQLLNTLTRIYMAPRLIYAWMLYQLGFKYCHYEAAKNLAKRLTL